MSTKNVSKYVPSEMFPTENLSCVDQMWHVINKHVPRSGWPQRIALICLFFQSPLHLFICSSGIVTAELKNSNESRIGWAASCDCMAVNSCACVKHASDHVSGGRWGEAGGSCTNYTLKMWFCFNVASLCKHACLICTSHFYFLSYINRLIAVLF